MKQRASTDPCARARPSRLLVSLVLLLVALPLAACDRNTEDFVEGEQPRQPDLARIFPDSQAGPRPGVGAPNPPGGALPMGQPMGQRGNVPPAASPGPAPGTGPRGAPPVAAQSGAGATISGTISIPPELAGGADGKAMLFVIARPFGVNVGPPMAVLRVPAPQFPFSFEIGPQNVMIPSMRFEGDIGITARLDGDGNAMTKLPGDLSGATDAPLRPGATDVSIVLDQKL
jgi:hypothetical protein